MTNKLLLISFVCAVGFFLLVEIVSAHPAMEQGKIMLKTMTINNNNNKERE